MQKSKVTEKKFKTLPLVVEGESKEVRYLGNGLVAIRLKPTIYSYTHNRTGIIPGTDNLRLRAITELTGTLKHAGLTHSYQDIENGYIISRLVLQPKTKICPKPFRPTDMTPAELAQLPVAPPIEVVVKQFHSGTPKHRYYQFDSYQIRPTISRRDNFELANDQPYPETVVRFDWRNPMHDTKGNRLADEVLCEPMANWFIDVEAAKTTALSAFDALSTYFKTKGLALWDICFFISEDGNTIFGEVSPDCMRIRAADGSALDKDVWRAGGSSGDIKQKWTRLAELLERK